MKTVGSLAIVFLVKLLIVATCRPIVVYWSKPIYVNHTPLLCNKDISITCHSVFHFVTIEPYLWRPSRLCPGTNSFSPLHCWLLTHNIQTAHAWSIAHLYADDSKVFGFCRADPTDVQHLRLVSMSCINDIADWMKCNRLQLNSSKSFASGARPHVGTVGLKS